MESTVASWRIRTDPSEPADELLVSGSLVRLARRSAGGGLQVELSVAQIELLRLVRCHPGLAVADADAQLLLTLSRDTVSTLVGQPTAGRWPNVTAWTSTAAARRGCGVLHGWLGGAR
jgi:hypothetical protein